MNTIDDSTALGLGMLTFLLIVVLYVWTALALSAVFRKSGEQPWKAWVPIYNHIVLLQLGGYSGWLYLLILLPLVGPLLVWGLLIAACYRINVAFGHGVGMTVLAALLLPVWASILGFGPARWLGTELTGRGAPGGGPRRTAAADVDDTAAYVPRATPPAYTPSLSLPPQPLSAPPLPAPPLPPASGWTPPPVLPEVPAPSASDSVGASGEQASFDAPPRPVAGRSSFEPQPDADAGRWGGFDLGAVSEVTSEVTGADSAAPAPISAVPLRPAATAAAPPAPPVFPPPLVAAPVASSATEPPITAPPVTRVPAMPAPEPAGEPWAPARSPLAGAEPFPETSGQVSAVVGAPDAGTPRSARASVSAQHTKSEIPDDPIDETIITRRRRTAWSLVPPTGAAIPLTAEIVLLGRKPAPDRAYPEAQLVSIDDGTVSKTHARLALRDDHWYVTDLGSTNGVLFATLMGTEVEATPGEEIEAGERFFLGDAEVRLQRSDG